MKSYADEGFLAESAQPFLLSDKWHRRKPRPGRICFWENWNFERNVVQNPSIAPEMHNTSRQLHKRHESVNKKGDSEEPPFTHYSSASQMAAFTALCQPFRRAARFASSISGRNTRSTSLFSMMSSVES